MFPLLVPAPLFRIPFTVPIAIRPRFNERRRFERRAPFGVLGHAIGDDSLENALRESQVSARKTKGRRGPLPFRLNAFLYRTQFPVDQFLPKSVIDKFTQDALAKVLRESFKNFVHMQEEAVMLRYVEIIERQPEFHVHSFPVITVGELKNEGRRRRRRGRF